MWKDCPGFWVLRHFWQHSNRLHPQNFQEIAYTIETCLTSLTSEIFVLLNNLLMHSNLNFWTLFCHEYSILYSNINRTLKFKQKRTYNIPFSIKFSAHFQHFEIKDNRGNSHSFQFFYIYIINLRQNWIYTVFRLIFFVRCRRRRRHHPPVSTFVYFFFNFIFCDTHTHDSLTKNKQ